MNQELAVALFGIVAKRAELQFGVEAQKAKKSRKAAVWLPIQSAVSKGIREIQMFLINLMWHLHEPMCLGVIGSGPVQAIGSRA